MLACNNEKESKKKICSITYYFKIGTFYVKWSKIGYGQCSTSFNFDAQSQKDIHIGLKGTSANCQS